MGGMGKDAYLSNIFIFVLVLTVIIKSEWGSAVADWCQSVQHPLKIL